MRVFPTRSFLVISTGKTRFLASQIRLLTVYVDEGTELLLIFFFYFIFYSLNVNLLVA